MRMETYRIVWISRRTQEAIAVQVDGQQVVEVLRAARGQAAGGLIIVQLISRAAPAGASEAPAEVLAK